MSDGEYQTELFSHSGEEYAHYNSHQDATIACHDNCLRDLNCQRAQGWTVVDIKKPEFEITLTGPGNNTWYYSSTTFILWQRKPMASAIYGD